MGLMWTKGFGGRHAGKLTTFPILLVHAGFSLMILGGGVVVDKHGARRAPFRFSLGRFSCFR